VEFMEDADTICAISTPPGEGGIGIIRISGKNAYPIVEKIFKPKKKKGEFASRKLYLGYIVNPNNNRELDEVFTVFMCAPHTYTREDVAEIYSHGGYAAQESILSLILGYGARLAEPGEFTKRAFLNGRIDLAQAESVLDIIHSETNEELQYAVKYLRGTLSKKIQRFQETLKRALVATEALIDFPEEDIDINLDKSLPSLKKTKTDIEKLVNSYYEGRGIKQGFEVLITGKANVGKSSLLNALLLKERAIVTPLPGTTRDLIEDTIYMNGMKVKIIDTAGIRKPSNVIEEEGIKRVKQKISETDLIIWLLDGSQPYSTDDAEVFHTIRHRNFLVAINKIDLPQLLKRDTLNSKGLHWLEISALKDTGLEELKKEAFIKLTGKIRKHSALLITSIRHRDALTKVKDNIERTMLLRERNEPLELIAFELHEGLHHLGEITGETCAEEILQEIFHQFCIGK